jgi:hypothetical protein
MQQRRQRPGDIVDDYCPRERRITDHAIVAMVEDDVQRTRCVVCDAEHEFKGARVPPQRKKKATAALFTQVLDGLEPPHARLASPSAGEEVIPGPDVSDAPDPASGMVVAAPPESAVPPEAPPAADSPGAEEGGFRRSLIRAQLPRLEGQPPPPRAIPEFTMHQPQHPRGRRSHRPGGSGPGHQKHRAGGRRGAGVDSGFGPMRSGHGNPGADRPQGSGRRRRRGKKGR